MTGDPRQTVAITPASASTRYAALLAALEEAYPVRFAAADGAGTAAASGAIAFPGGGRPQAASVPCLVLEGPGAAPAPGAAFTVELSRCAELDRPLHGQHLVERDRAAPPALQIPAGGRALALAGGRPIWTQSGAGDDCQTASAVPGELAGDEFLRDHLTAGRFWSLLPLVQFVRRIALRGAEPARPIRACFVIDDPNVRLPSYGYVRFPELARDARECGYHVAMATIPLDLLLPGRGAVPVFREFPRQLSLAVHGNDHVHRELERERGPAAAERMIRVAAARVARFEARAGVRIDRVMCPPHGGCSAETLTALHRCGFLGLAASRPFPWDAFADQRSWRLGGWLPAQLAGGGIPVLSRYHLGRSLDDLVFRAWLGQPLIVYCHHTDLRDGLGPLRAATARAAALGEVRFGPLAVIARGNAACRVRDGVATMTLYSGDVRLPRPAAETLRIELPRTFGAGGRVRLEVDGVAHDVALGADGSGSLSVPNGPAGADLRVRIVPPGGAAPPPPRRRPGAWPLARRAMTEARDRALPLVRDLG